MTTGCPRYFKNNFTWRKRKMQVINDRLWKSWRLKIFYTSSWTRHSCPGLHGLVSWPHACLQQWFANFVSRHYSAKKMSFLYIAIYNYTSRTLYITYKITSLAKECKHSWLPAELDHGFLFSFIDAISLCGTPTMVYCSAVLILYLIRCNRAK